MLQHLINHVSLVVDKSGSMTGKPVVKVFDAALERLKQRSIDLNQETRISIYLFNDTIECLTFDMDVMRFTTLEGHYRANGNTALISATLKSIFDHEQLPEMYGDHAHLQYVITDGENNVNNEMAPVLARTLKALKENWTIACLVPSALGKHEAKKFGFPEDSIAIWDTSAVGLERVGQQFTATMDTYMSMRSSGIRSTKSLFTLNVDALKRNALTPLNARDYEIHPVFQDAVIKDWVELFTKKPYRLGSTYYMPTKKVKIQGHKTILVQEVKTGNVYEGDDLRGMLGLPAQTVDVDPVDHAKWRIFVQSTSSNRKLFANTFVLVMK